MLAEERFAMILDLLAQKRSATVLELCDALDASESTIRRDLTQLDRQGLLKRYTVVPRWLGALFWRMSPPWRPARNSLWKKSV